MNQIQNQVPDGFILLQRENGKPIYAACMTGKFAGWLMWKHPDGQWVSKRKLEPWEIMQVEDQRDDDIVQETIASTTATAPVSQTAQCAAPDERHQFVAYWRAKHQYSAEHKFLDDAGNFCTPEDDPIHFGWMGWQARASLAPPAPAAAPDAQPDLLANFLDLTQLVAAWASSSKYEADMIDKVRELQPHIKAAITAAQPEQQPVGYVNGDELDNMLNDRTATIAGKKDGWRTVAVYRAAPVPAAAPGPLQAWKLVPGELTEEMAVAFCDAWYSKVRAFDDPEMDDAYAALLAAAPVGGGDHG